MNQIPQESGMTTLESEADLTRCVEQSERGPVFIFKHSTRCPVSARALEEVRAYAAGQSDGSAPVFINYVVESRGVSNQIASMFGVRHESPQLLLVRGRTSRWSTSHGGITSHAMQSVVSENEPEN